MRTAEEGAIEIEGNDFETGGGGGRAPGGGGPMDETRGGESANGLENVARDLVDFLLAGVPETDEEGRGLGIHFIETAVSEIRGGLAGADGEDADELAATLGIGLVDEFFDERRMVDGEGEEECVGFGITDGEIEFRPFRIRTIERAFVTKGLGGITETGAREAEAEGEPEVPVIQGSFAIVAAEFDNDQALLLGVPGHEGAGEARLAGIEESGNVLMKGGKEGMDFGVWSGSMGEQGTTDIVGIGL